MPDTDYGKRPDTDYGKKPDTDYGTVQYNHEGFVSSVQQN